MSELPDPMTISVILDMGVTGMGGDEIIQLTHVYRRWFRDRRVPISIRRKDIAAIAPRPSGDGCLVFVQGASRWLRFEEPYEYILQFAEG
jgi:hypothetical protein